MTKPPEDSLSPSIAGALSGVVGGLLGSARDRLGLLRRVRAPGSWGGLLGHLPTGSSRAFLAQAFDSSGTLLSQGSASDVALSAHQTALVAIQLL